MGVVLCCFWWWVGGFDVVVVVVVVGLVWWACYERVDILVFSIWYVIVFECGVRCICVCMLCGMLFVLLVE